MPRSQANSVLQYIRKVTHTKSLLDLADPDLLKCFVAERDPLAFTALVRRHGPMVLGLCSRILRNQQDAEDAFQATFLIFSRQAASLQPHKSLAGWIYSVAYRTAQKAKLAAIRRHKHEAQAPIRQPIDPLARMTVQEAHEILHRELAKLPDKFRVPLVLCYLEGLTRDEAAQRLSWPVTLLKTRLEQARDRLRTKLASRGLALAGILITSLFDSRPACGAVPAGLLQSTVQSGAAIGTAILLPPRVVALTEGVAKAMFLNKVKTTMFGLLALSVISLGLGLYAQQVLAGKPQVEETPTLERAKGDTIHLPARIVSKIGIQVAEVRSRFSPAGPQLQLTGSLMYDSEQLHRIRTRFAPSTVLSLAKLDPQNRSLVVGDQVKKDQLLAQLYCASIGAKKDELYEALLAQKRTDALLGRVAAAIRNGQGPEATVADALKQVESSKKTIDVCLQDLRTMGVAESEIEAIRREANKAPAEEKANNSDKQKARRDKWSNVELRAPVDGIVVEINVNALEHIADSKQNLFQIAGLERLKVVLHASKEEVPSLPLLKGVERRWTIQPYQSEDALTRKDHLRQRLLREADRERLQALTQDQLDKRDSAKIDLDRLWQRIDLALDAPVEGVVIEDLTYEIDPAQHTAILKGYIDNKKQLLHAGQFVTATVNLAPPAPEVVLPASALVETGGQVFVFVQLDAKKMAYEQRRVAVVRRGKDEVHISGRLTAEERQKGFQTVRLGEQVVTSGVLELKAMLDELKANQDR